MSWIGRPGAALAACCCAILLTLNGCRAARPRKEALLTDQAIVQPLFPDSYQVSYVFSLPYTQKIQPHGIRYPVTFWRDGAGGRFRLDTYGGVNSIISKQGLEYELAPRIDTRRCFVWKGDGGSEEETGDMPERALPDVRGWAYAGEESLNGQQAQLWVYERRHLGKQVRYKFYAAPNGTPLRLHLHGMDPFDRAHFDEWVADYHDYRPGTPDRSLFETLKLCEGVAPESPELLGGVGQRRLSAGGLRMRSLLPAVTYGGDAGYDAFLATHGSGRSLRSLEEYRLRAELYRSNAALIAAHNAANHSYTMAMNRFGDWTHEEFLALMLPKRGRALQAASAKQDRESPYEIPHTPLTDPARVPQAVSWVGTGADSTAVKTQANCGSCYAFGAAGACEAAWFMATGQRVSFSEQQIIDCSWDHGDNMACNGGDAWAGIEYVAASGGLAVTADYEYLGQDAYCRDKSTRRVGKFKGYARIPQYSDALVMEAVYSRGPIAISIDASQPGFKFYSSGVYFDPGCGWRLDDLDHAVVLVGYGSTPKGVDYWLVRNSWSDMWGDGGYVKISRDQHGCGVPADAVYAVVDERAL